MSAMEKILIGIAIACFIVMGYCFWWLFDGLSKFC